MLRIAAGNDKPWYNKPYVPKPRLLEGIPAVSSDKFYAQFFYIKKLHQNPYTTFYDLINPGLKEDNYNNPDAKAKSLNEEHYGREQKDAEQYNGNIVLNDTDPAAQRMKNVLRKLETYAQDYMKKVEGSFNEYKK